MNFYINEDVITGLINIFKNLHSKSKYIFTFHIRLSLLIKNVKSKLVHQLFTKPFRFLL